jgi:hypothetical protein
MVGPFENQSYFQMVNLVQTIYYKECVPLSMKWSKQYLPLENRTGFQWYNHLKTQLQKVQFSDVWGLQMFGKQTFTVDSQLP